MFTQRTLKFLSYIFICLIFITGYSAQAQQRTVTGKVTSKSDGVPIPGVNISVAGTSTGIVTDFDGMYSIEVSGSDAVLVFSYLGFLSQRETVGDRNEINVALEEDISALNEVVVVGYGTQKKSDITGAVSSVASEELTAFPVLSGEQALQGRAAGVAVQSNNGGEPGAPIKIRIRGGTSINASSDALVVVDGFVGASMPPPEDIASMEVLKDASATAIYGSRASNGVILVTTKRGQIGKVSIELNSSYSIQEVNNTLDLLDADEFADYRSSYSDDFTPGNANTDWQDVIYRQGSIASHQVSFSGGGESARYYVSGTFFDQKGAIINSDLERFSFLANIDLDVTDNFKVGLNTFGRRNSTNGVSTQAASGGAGSAGVVSSAYRFAPDLGIYDANDEFTINSLGDDIDNPFATATEKVNERVADLYRANFFAEYFLLENLSFKTTLGFSTYNALRGTFIPTTLISGAGVGGEATVENSRDTDIITENYLTYNEEIGKAEFKFLAGYSYQKSKGEDSFAGAREFVTNSVSYRNLGGGSTYLKPESSLTERELISLFGRINFDWDDRYLLTFTARRDGSSSFSKNNKYAFFPSGAIGWNMGNEAFLEDSELISAWKWRASYGVTGNPSIPAYGTLARFSEIYSVINDEITNAVAVTVLANDNLKWESSYQTDFGVDIALFKNRLNLTADYYKIQTKDLLFARPLPEYVGLANPYQIQNIGELENKGFEFTLFSRNFVGDNFKWNTRFNFATNKNKVVKLPNGDDIIIDSTPGHFLQDESQILREGEPVGSFYGYVYEGVIQEGDDIPEGFENEPGGELFADLNGDGQINSDDKTIIGDPNPDYTAGLNNEFLYKNFDMNLFFQASVGGDILNYTLLELASGDSNATTDVLNAYTPSNTNTNIPAAAVREKRVTSRYVYDGSYIRLKNLSVGYSLPNDIIERFGFQKVRFSLSGQNLLTFTDYPGVDPEVNYRNNNNERSNTNLGLDYGSYPNVKSYTLGVNLKF
ncbi:SusC/RagA family TonB-linked outer membrane protein [Christiangramia crocea]|uniref:TonB-dependent receptor n=1 Tax=Christiangramia crocea TaxID=2904124 RepID=A0A9X1UUW6_9FLAO|nr:TonB-dependent receptor [Gramella crocea]MCG9970541.1 TonB-dependent receptor [Gramella crocea]